MQMRKNTARTIRISTGSGACGAGILAGKKIRRIFDKTEVKPFTDKTKHITATVMSVKSPGQRPKRKKPIFFTYWQKGA